MKPVLSSLVSQIILITIYLLAPVSQVSLASAAQITVKLQSQWEDYLRTEWTTLVAIGKLSDQLKLNRRTNCPIGGPGDNRMRPEGAPKSLWYIIEGFMHMRKHFDEARWALRREMRVTCPHWVPKIESGINSDSDRLPIVGLTEEEIDRIRYPEEAAQAEERIAALNGRPAQAITVENAVATEVTEEPNTEQQQGLVSHGEVGNTGSQLEGQVDLKNIVGYDPQVGPEIYAEHDSDYELEYDPGDGSPRPDYYPWILRALSRLGCDHMNEVEEVSWLLGRLVAKTEGLRTRFLYYSLRFETLMGFQFGLPGATWQDNIRKLAEQIDSAKINPLNPGAQPSTRTITYDTEARFRLTKFLQATAAQMRRDIEAMGSLESDVESYMWGRILRKAAGNFPVPHVPTQSNEVLTLMEGIKEWNKCWRRTTLTMVDLILNVLGRPPDPTPPRWGTTMTNPTLPRDRNGGGGGDVRDGSNPNLSSRPA